MAKGVQTFTCENCKSADMSLEELRAHLTEVHKIDVLRKKGKREMMMHMDGRDWFGGTNRWSYGEGDSQVVIIESYRYKRDKNNMMY